MVNNEEVLDYALGAGANGLEMDMRFNSTGAPADFYKNWLCDCKCASSAEVCKFDVCENARPSKDVLGHFMSHKKMGQVAMLYIDSKLDGVQDDLLEQAGVNIVTMLEEVILRQGYKGIILMGAANEEYLTSLAATASKSPFKDQLFIGYDWHTNFKDGLEFLADLKYLNKIASTGIFRCLKWAIGYEEEAVLGRVNKARGVISDMIIWTLDKTEEYTKYYGYGARGIISNNIKQLVAWAKTQGHELYTTEDTICGALVGRENLVTDVGDCGCENKGDGCRINEVGSVKGSACRCSKKSFFGFVWCRGDVVGCEDVGSGKCLNPDRSQFSCRQGAGNCGGY